MATVCEKQLPNGDEIREPCNDENDGEYGAEIRRNGQQNNEITKWRAVRHQNVLSKPWKMILKNIDGLISENSKRKIDYIQEYVQDENIAFMKITETWLNESIKEDAEIEGYTLYRGDRKEIKRGGTAIYINNKLEATQVSELSHKKCELIAVYIPSLQTINIVIYRPPKPNMKNFILSLRKFKKYLMN